MKIKTKCFLSVLVVFMVIFFGVSLSRGFNGSVFVTATAADTSSLPEDGIILSEDDIYCSCCHSHEHPKTIFGRYACFTCKIGKFFRSFFGMYEDNAPHKYILAESVAPTCFTEGERVYECGVCKKTESFTDVRLMHKPKTVEGRGANCTEEGLTDGSVCELCNTEFVVQQVIPALGHLEVIDAKIAPTCTENGISEGKHCGRCTLVLTKQEPIPATGHDFTDGDTVTNLKIYKTGINKVTADITCYSCKQKFADFAIDAAASVGGYSKIYHTLEAAVKAARNTDVYLISDYTLNENLTIPSGVTVVIPSSAADTGYAKRDDDGFYSKYCPDNYTQVINKHCFRVLNIPAGKTVTVANGGTLFISAVTGLFGGGNPESYGVSDGYGEINLGGIINVQSGGIFDCSGYVSDDGGTVNLLSGAKMFETYGILYWRGGSYGFAARNKDIFPIDGYEMNYMRAKLNIAAGAVLLGNCKMCAGSITNLGQSQYYYCHFKLLGYDDNYLYQLKNSARAERTIEPDGRSILKVYGDVNFGISSITVGAVGFKTSAFQAYKVGGNYSYEFYDGTVTCNQKCQFMPGATVTVGKGATFNITGSGALIFCTAKDYTVNGKTYPGYYSYDSRYEGALYPAGRDDAKLYVKDGGKVNVKGSLLGYKAALAGMVYVDSASSVNFDSYAKSEAVINVAVGPVKGSSILASVDAEKYTVPYIANKIS